MFDSKLPENINWEEVSDFLRTTKFYNQLLLEYWRESDAFETYPISNTSIECLRCIHEDLLNCYIKTFAFDENGKEDRNEEYRLLEVNLFSKYNKLDHFMLKRIFFYYLREDR